MREEKIHKIVKLKPEEQVVAIVHQSLMPQAGRVAVLVLNFLLPFFFMFPLWRSGIIGVAIFLAWLGVAVYLLVRLFFRFANTVLVITDRRVVDVDQKAIFDRVVSEAPFAQIDEVTYRIQGVAPTIFRYGQVNLSLSGNAANIEFTRVKYPARVHGLIQDLRQVIVDETRDRRENKIRDLAEKTSLEELAEMEMTLHGRQTEAGLAELYNQD